MKHSEEWHTCDRCGEKIENVPGKNLFPNILFPRITRTMLKNQISLRTFVAEREKQINAGEDYCSIPEIGSIIIEEWYNTKEKEFDLCPKCRKDFEEFMKNDR